MSDPAVEVAETIQTASIKRDPSPTHDINPATAASEKTPVVRSPPSEAGSIPSDIVDPSRVIRPLRRRHHLPPLPDLRFEQSYLASLKGADTWGRIAWITIRDQVILPLLQGTLWTLALAGWRHWNRSASVQGHTLGSRIRKWWYEVNNWELSHRRTVLEERKLAGQAQDYYVSRFSNVTRD